MKSMLSTRANDSHGLRAAAASEYRFGVERQLRGDVHPDDVGTHSAGDTSTAIA